MRLADDVGTPGPWKAAPHTVTRRILEEVLEAIWKPRPGGTGTKPGATASQIAAGVTPENGESAMVFGSDRIIDVSLQLLKRWGLITYLKRERVWVGLTYNQGDPR